MTTRLLPILVLLAALHAPAAAQAPAYARPAGDTLRWREVSERVIQTPGAPRKVLRQDATIALAFTVGDTARAWYDGLRLEETDGDGQPRLAGDVAGLAFVLAFGPRGVDTVLSVPEFPDEVRAKADLRWQFRDFFPRLPDAPLLPGTAWADTIVRHRTVEGAGSGIQAKDTRIASYRVVGDSVIGAHPVVVVEARAETNGVLGGHLLGVEVRGTSRETEQGRFYFDAAAGLLVRRVRSATGVVDLTYSSREGPRSVRRSDEFTAAIDLLEGRHQ